MSDRYLTVPREIPPAGAAIRPWTPTRGRIRHLIRLMSLLVACCLPRAALAVIAMDPPSSRTSSGTSSNITLSHTTSAGANRLLIVGVDVRDRSVTSVRYNGINLTRAGFASNSDEARAEIWYLLAPPSGTFNVVVNLSGEADVVIGAATFTGVHQTTPLGTLVGRTGDSSTPSAPVSSAAGEWVFDTMAAREVSSISVGAGQTQVWNTGVSGLRGGASTEPGAASVTMSWSMNESKKWAIAAVPIKPAPETTTLGNGSDPGSTTLAPGDVATMADAFTFQTSGGTDVINAVTVALAAGSSGGLSLVEITNDAGTVVYGSVANPASDTPSISLTGLTATTTPTQYRIRVTPKSHAAMPVPPGSSYTVTARVSDWTGTNQKAGSDAAGATVTIDNLSPGNVTASTATAGNAQVTLGWTNPGDGDLGTIIVLRRAGGAVGDAPVEGATYTVGNTIGSSTVACVVTAPAAGCTSAGLTNGTVYHYKIFTRDTRGNYSAGAVPGGSPATPLEPRVDLMIKRSAETGLDYLTDGTYETTATTQVKSQGVPGGSTASYHVQIQNDGAANDNVVVTGTASGSNFTVQYLDETATDRTAAVTGAGYTIAGLAGGASRVWTLNVTPAFSVANGTVYDVFVTGTSTNDGTRKDQVKATTSSATGVLSLVKSADRATAKPGQTVVYTLTYGNPGGADIENLVITDVLPANTTIVPGSITDAGVLSAGTITWTLAGLPQGAANRTVRFSVTVNAGVAAGTVIPNVGRGDFQCPAGTARPTVTSNTVNLTVDVLSSVSVGPDQASSGSSATGTQMNYTFTITNTGNSPDYFDLSIVKAGPYRWPTDLYNAAGTTLLARDSNADGIWDYVNPSFDGDADGFPQTGVLAPGASQDVLLRLILPPGTNPGHRDVTYLVATSNVGPLSERATASASASAIASAPILILTKTDSPDPILSGNVITYAMTYRNTGPRNADGVVLLDAIPQNTTYVAGSATGEPGVLIEFSTNNRASWGSAPADPATVTDIRWTIGRVDRNSATMQAGFRVRTNTALPDPTVVLNTAVLKSGDVADVPANASTTVTSGVDLQNGEKTVEPDFAAPGDTLTYTIVIQNRGVRTGTNVVVTDVVPANTAYVPGSISGPGANASGAPTLVWNPGSLAPGVVAAPLIYKVVVDNPIAANTFSIVNFASVASDQTPPVNTNIVTVPLSAGPFFLTGTKNSLDVNGGTLSPGDLIEYRITATNTGNMNATGVVVTDTIPAGTTYVPGSISGTGADASGAPILRWNIGGLNGGATTAALVFRVSVNGGLPAGTVINNRARIVSDQTIPVFTPFATNTVGGATTGIIQSTSPIMPGDPVTLRVQDADLNTNSSTIENFFLATVNLATGETENRTYTETGPATGVFTATVATAFGTTAGANNDGVFNVQAGDALQTVYNDAANASGVPATSTATTLVVAGGVTGTLAATTPILPGDTVTLTLTDADLNTNSSVVESVALTTTNTGTGETEIRTCTETGPATGVFTATVATVLGTTAGTNNDGVFNVQAGDVLGTLYLDARTASGGTATISAETSVIGAQVTLQKTASVPSAPPGGSITYQLVHTNDGAVDAYAVVTSDSISVNTDFQLGSEVFVPGSSGLTASVAFSSDGGITYTYTPVSGGGGAPAGFDRLVTHIRWTFTGTLSRIPPGNSFLVRYTVRVR